MIIGKKWVILTICVLTFYILVVITFDEFKNMFFSKSTLFVNSKKVVVTNPAVTVIPTSIKNNENNTSCYNETSNDNGFLELDYSKGAEEPKLGKSIFFHETSCFGEEGFRLNARQACAVESAAKVHPKMSVYLLYLSPSKISKSAKQLIEQLLTYENIKIRRINSDKYIKNTPLEKWYNSGILKTSHWPKIHMSDLLRYLTLWKYGGIYMDLDVVVMKNLEDLGSFAGSQDIIDVAVGVMGFGMDELGRKIANDCVNEVKNNFLGHIWANSGPGVITRTLQKHCDVQHVKDMTKSQCHGFNVLPPSVFYPIFYPSWKKYFELDENNETMKMLEESKAIHVWNKLSNSEKIKVGSNVPYAKIAEKYCPKVYRNCGTFF